MVFRDYVGDQDGNPTTLIALDARSWMERIYEAIRRDRCDRDGPDPRYTPPRRLYLCPETWAAVRTEVDTPYGVVDYSPYPRAFGVPVVVVLPRMKED